MVGLTQFLVILTVFYFLWKHFVGSKRQRLIDKIPGPRAYPIIGNIFDVMLPSDQTLPIAFERAQKYGPIIRFWLGSMAVVGVSKAEYVEVILGSNKEIDKGFVYRMVEAWLGKGLLTSAGSRWAQHRKMITPTFHFKILDSFIPIYESQSKVLVDKLSPFAHSQDVLDIYPYITRCALDIICETAMGINFKAQESMTSDYINAIYRISHLITKRFSRIYLHPQWIYGLTPSGREAARCLKVLHDFTGKVIAERKQYWANLSPQQKDSSDTGVGVKTRKAFLDLLINTSSDLTDQDIREEVDTFMFEGHDTTTAGICWTIYLLGLHPEIQEQAAEEICLMWPDNEPLTNAILTEMKILDRVIKESLRLYPSVPFISRTLIDEMKFGEYIVPANTTVSISPALLHRDATVFPEPDKFDPDRFLPENMQGRHPYAYVPFSAGPRNCIGQKFAMLEEKAVLASFLRSFKVQSIEKPADVGVVTELIQRPKNGIKVKLSRRTT